MYHYQKKIAEEVSKYTLKEATSKDIVKGITEGGVKDALADYLYSIPKKAIEELKPVMKIKNLTKRFAMITKVLKKHGFNDKFMGSFPSNVVNDYYDTFFGESAELGEAHAKDIVKGITDMDGPFTVVAIKNNKVIKQETTKMRDALPAIVKMMRKEVGSGVTISIEGKKGILNTFKEEVEVTEAKDAPSEKDLMTWYKATGAVSPFEGAVPTYKNLKKMYTKAKAQQGKAWDIWKKLVEKGTVKEEVEVTEVASPAQQKKNTYAEREAQAKEIAKKILQVAKERGVRVYTDGSRVVSATKDFPKGDVGAFNKAYNDCGMVLTHMRFTKNGNQWGCSSSGFGVGAQECVKAGRAQQHKSGDGGSLIIKFLKV